MYLCTLRERCRSLMVRSSERAVLRRDWLTARAPPRPPVLCYLLTSRRRRSGRTSSRDAAARARVLSPQQRTKLTRARTHTHARICPASPGGAAHCVFKKHRDIRCALINCLCPVQEGGGAAQIRAAVSPHPPSPIFLLLFLLLLLPSLCISVERPTLAAIFTQGRSQSCREAAEQAEPVTWAEPAAASRWRRRSSRSRSGSGRRSRSRRRTRKLLHRNKKGKMVRRKSLDENEPECGKGIPFPIQTFLWRQTRLVSVSENRCLFVIVGEATKKFAWENLSAGRHTCEALSHQD